MCGRRSSSSFTKIVVCFAVCLLVASPLFAFYGAWGTLKMGSGSSQESSDSSPAETEEPAPVVAEAPQTYNEDSVSRLTTLTESSKGTVKVDTDDLKKTIDLLYESQKALAKAEADKAKLHLGIALGACYTPQGLGIDAGLAFTKDRVFGLITGRIVPVAQVLHPTWDSVSVSVMGGFWLF